MRIGLVAFGMLNSVLYASLLPLWEGFDEPFHYGYVTELSRRGALPRLGETPTPADICQSLLIAPASHVVKHNLPFVTTFDEYFRLSQRQRQERQETLARLRPSAEKGECGGNYEALQAPLAYLPLAAVDSLLDGWGLPARVWLLRLICALSASIASACLLFRLASALRIASRSADVAVFVMLSLQMFYGTVAHIANDWLAVPLMILFFERLVSTHDRPRTLTVCSLAATLGLGLLTKSYFLSVLPVAAWLVCSHALSGRMRWRTVALFGAIAGGLAGPWYARNIIYYGNLAGLQELSHGGGLREFTTAAAHLPWGRSIVELCFASIWTGNNSDLSFSRTTLTLFLAVLVSLLVLRMIRAVVAPERYVIAGCAAYAAALLYSTAVSFWATNGSALRTSSWYSQPILPIVTLIAVSATARFSLLTSTLKGCLVALSSYILVLTYWVKLIPLYGGYTGGRATLPRIVEWYRQELAGGMEVLSSTALAGHPILILGLAGATTAGSVLLALFLCAYRKPRPSH